MKLTNNQIAPTFSIQDALGNSINLGELKGKKVLLSFYRFAGCPICNFRFHEIETNMPFFESNNIVVIGVYESSPVAMKTFIEGENFKTTLIPNPTLSLYNQYGLELSTGKVIKGIFNGALKKAKAGKKLFKQSIKQDGNTNRIGGDFLIDEQGKIILAHYGNFVGDDLPIETINQAFQNK